MTPKRKIFADEYLIDLNAARAYRAAGYRGNDNVCKVEGHRLLTNPNVAAYIAAAQAERAQRTEITQDMVLKRWWEIAMADPNEIIHFRRTCCRHCFGEDHEYQWRDEEEFIKASLAAKDASPADMPSNAGGYGFDKTADPNADCPRCMGEGIPDIHATDTRKLSGAARALYAGVKQTQAGFEIKMQDQGKALENVARHLGMFKDGGPQINLSVGLGLEAFYGSMPKRDGDST